MASNNKQIVETFLFLYFSFASYFFFEFLNREFQFLMFFFIFIFAYFLRKYALIGINGPTVTLSRENPRL